MLSVLYGGVTFVSYSARCVCGMCLLLTFQWFVSSRGDKHLLAGMDLVLCANIFYTCVALGCCQLYNEALPTEVDLTCPKPVDFTPNETGSRG